MNSVEDLLEQTLARAAESVAPLSGLADRALVSARRIRARRRSGAVVGVAVLAAAAVAVASFAGTSHERTGLPSHSPTPIPSLAPTSQPPPPSPSPSASPTSPSPGSDLISTHAVLAQLHVLFADGTSINDGDHVVRLHPLPAGNPTVITVARLHVGYVVSLIGTGHSTLARVDGDGTLHAFDTSTNGEPAGVFDQFAVSADEQTIAYARWKVSGARVTTTVRVISQSGQLLQSKQLVGFYSPRAVDAAQVWLDSDSQDASSPPAVWDRTSGATESLDLGDQTTLRAVSLTAGRAVLRSDECNLMLVDVTAPTHVVAKRCADGALAFSADGTVLVTADDAGDYHVRSPTDLHILWTAPTLSRQSVIEWTWTSGGHFIGLDPDIGGIVDIDQQARTFTFHNTRRAPDVGLALAPLS